MMGITFSSTMGCQLVDAMGDDLAIVCNARVSTRGSDAGRETGEHIEGLINYLMKARHGSVFEAGVMKFLVRVPIFVMRELHRHRMSSFNEESGRYKQLDPEFYVPGPERNLKQVGKPGHYEYVPGSANDVVAVSTSIKLQSESAYRVYQDMLDHDIAREVARMVLPVNIYSSCYVTMNTRSLMNFLSLRVKSEDSTYISYPQREIEMLAEQMEAAFAEKFPITYAAFIKHGRVSP